MSSQIATHYEQAGAAEQAVKWYSRSAQGAQLLHAHTHPIELLDRALRLLRSLPESPRRAAVELELRTARPFQPA